MDYLFYCRDRPDTTALLERFTEKHWSFMDGYADRLIARGPTLTADGNQHTGSLHIVDLAAADDTEPFAYQEPFYKAGVYAEVMIRRWENLIGRTMWDFRTSSADPLFLILAQAAAQPEGAVHDFADARRGFAVKYRDQMVVYGSMSSIDGAHWKGFAEVIQMPSREAVEAMLADDPLLGSASVAKVEIHRWCMGGGDKPHRPQARPLPDIGHLDLQIAVLQHAGARLDCVPELAGSNRQALSGQDRRRNPLRYAPSCGEANASGWTTAGNRHRGFNIRSQNQSSLHGRIQLPSDNLQQLDGRLPRSFWRHKASKRHFAGPQRPCNIAATAEERLVVARDQSNRTSHWTQRRGLQVLVGRNSFGKT
jgi:uncharacterized protein